MLRALIFDFNGIIVDDEPIHFELFKQVLAEEGIKLTEADYYARYLGFDDRGAFTAAYREHGRALDEKLLARLIDRKAIYYQSEIRSKVRIFPGVEKLVAALLKHFAVIISAEDVDHGKPEPEIFLKALARLNAQVEDGHPIDTADCLVIEDSKEGIRGARRAGMKCLAVSNSHPIELLQEANAVVRSLEEVNLSLLEKLCA